MPKLDKVNKSCKPILKKFLKKLNLRSLLKGLKDPRQGARRPQWDFDSVIRRNFEAILSGVQCMRGIEYFSDALGVRLPATTNHDILVATDAAPLRKNLAEQVIRSQRNGELTQDFPLRIAAIDGKDLSTSRIDAGEYSMAQGGKFRNRAIRAMLVTSATKIFLGQHMIPGDTTEKKVFLDFVDELLELYEDEPVFDVVSVDAGFASYKNFKGLRERGVPYIMAIKNNIPTLYKLLLAVTDKPGETYDVDTVVHRGPKERTHKNLVRSRAPYHKNWRGITEVWRVTQKTEYYCEVWDEWLPKETKTRLFITNVEPEKLDSSQVMEAVRAHWGIESVPQHIENCQERYLFGEAHQKMVVGPPKSAVGSRFQTTPCGCC